jgi:hypothetical protein
MVGCNNEVSMKWNQLFVSFLSFAPVTAAFSQDISWEKVKIFGGGHGERCNDSNSAFVPTGPEASFLLSTFGINMPKSRGMKLDPQSRNSSCNLEAAITIPQGYYMKTLTQKLSLSVLKDIGATGGISTNGFVFQNQIPVNQINVFLKPEEVYRPENSVIERTNVQIFSPEVKSIMCAQSAFGPLRTVFKLQLLTTGNRLFTNQGFLLNVGNQDVVFGLSPSIVPCSE